MIKRLWSKRLGHRATLNVSLVMAIGLWGAGPVTASPAPTPNIMPPTQGTLLLARQGKISLEQAVAKVKAKYPGKVLSAKRIDSQGPLVYRIKVLSPDSRVHVVYVDATNGEVFKTQ